VSRDFLNVGWAERLRRAIDGIGGSPYTRLTEGLQPGVTVEDMTRPEFEYLQRGGLYVQSAFAAAGGAGTNSMVTFFPVFAVGLRLYVIERAWAWAFAASQNVQIGFLTPLIAFGAGTTVNPQTRDERVFPSGIPFAGGPGAPVTVPSGAQLVAGALAAPGATVLTDPVIVTTSPTAGAVTELPAPWVVSRRPLVFQNAVANASLRVLVQWRERDILRNEAAGA
jgi:hypothetical protein